MEEEEVALAGNWRQQLAHFEEWLCALLPCPRLLLPPPVGGREAEKALIISIDCASSRARDTAASGQQRPRGWHCPEPIILKTGRLPRITRRPHTHSSQITPTLIGAEELCSASVHFLSGMAVDAALSSVSGDKEEKAACSSNRGRVGPKLEVVSASLRPN